MYFNQNVRFDDRISFYETYSDKEYDRKSVNTNEDFKEFINKKIVKIVGDGNCQFSAIGYFLNEYYDDVRYNVCNELKMFKENYEHFIDTNFDEYVDNMMEDGVWGDHITLTAAAQAYTINIVVFSKSETLTKTEIILKDTYKTIYLYHNNYHYDVLD